MSLKQLYVNGKDPEPAHRLANAQFLHRELPVRLSQRAVELMNLPHGLSDVPGIQQVRLLACVCAYVCCVCPRCLCVCLGTCVSACLRWHVVCHYYDML